MNAMADLAMTPGVAGVDEAGRGPLAGPVVAAAVILPDGFDVAGINDSKKLSPHRREELAVRIRKEAVWAVEAAEPQEIDRLNILHASLAAMSRALDALGVVPDGALIDGNRVPLWGGCSLRAVVKGDGKYAAIAAASILAKTCRDAIMREAAKQYPGYGFELHFGYPTPAHLEALKLLGPCPIHRRSFSPVREALLDRAGEMGGQCRLVFDD